MVLHSEQEAAECFPAEELAKLKKQVNFTQQVVLLFAWKGSGQDKLTHAVAESYPEQIFYPPTRAHARPPAPRARVRPAIQREMEHQE